MNPATITQGQETSAVRRHPTVVPRGTYRVQLQPAFGFASAAELADYLDALGISHLYASPCLQAAAGSTHGYDAVNHSCVSDELGGAKAHAQLTQAMRQRGLGQVLDIVPNHMSITGRENAWWWDVLRRGQASPYAGCFDIDWRAPEARLHGKVLIPILGDHFGRVIEAGEIRLERSEGDDLVVRYHDHYLPVSDESAAALPRENAAALDRELQGINSDPDALEGILRQQHYRLAHWRTAAFELNYRRFFDINNLIGLRIEQEPVFRQTHGLILRWLQEGVIDGVRIDHPDGLRDPEEYFQRLRQAGPDAWIVVEKILEPGEHLPETWPVQGTTGYDFLNLASGLFVDPAAEERLTRFYAHFTGEPTDYLSVLYAKKHLVMRKSFAGEVNRLTSILVEIVERHRTVRDYTRLDLHEALREVVACFPVYRAYVRPGSPVSEQDVKVTHEAVAHARKHRPDIDPRLFGFLADLLLLRVEGQQEAEFAARFQQLTGPIMAKGAEDTAFYCFNRLTSLNEVGGDPARFGVSVEQFHQTCAWMQQHWPHAMLSSSTHDTKRSEDVRARLHLLSEIPQQWEAAVSHWTRINSRHQRGRYPDRNAEYLLYQTLVGAWPLETDRAVAYMVKASHEAKQHTSWVDPNPEYDQALRGFVEDVLADDEFRQALESFVRPLIEPGRINSLAQTLLKMTAPGVPDIYQGTELWDLSLVDPDNRRPVDFALRRRLLAAIEHTSPEQALGQMDVGLPKLLVIQRALSLRKRLPEVFERGDYQPLAIEGSRSQHAVAFARGDQVITVVPRLVIGLHNDWGQTMVQCPPGRWRNLLTGDEVAGDRVALWELLRRFPVALLERQTQ